MDVTTLTTEELMKRKESIELKCDHWKQCKDGSHGMALDAMGYFKITTELYRRDSSETTR